MDKIGTELINTERVKNGHGTSSPSHIHAASLPPYSLGTDDLAQIEFIEIDAAATAAAPEPWPVRPEQPC